MNDCMKMKAKVDLANRKRLAKKVSYGLFIVSSLALVTYIVAAKRQ